MRPLSFFSLLLSGSSLANSETIRYAFLGADAKPFTIPHIYRR